MIRQHLQVIRIVGWRQYLLGYWEDVRDYFLRFIFAQHNARYIIELEGRLVSVIHEATGYMMSKPTYTEEAMLAAIREHHSRLYDEAYEDGRKDLAELHDIDLTEEETAS